MSFKIGNIELKNQIVLAPMAGISNPAFIKILEKMGLGLAYTELISAEAIVRDNKKTFAMLKGIESLNVPLGVQLFGSNAQTLAKAAKIVTDLYPNVFIDLNMGCPVPKVALKAHAGSALMKSPEKVKEIVEAVVKAINRPVSVKIRSGWDEFSINAVEIAQICEKAGASAITVHARTRKQGYSGKANWQIIKDVVEAVSIPVIGNGDVLSCYDAEKMLAETGCCAVMIGRGVLGNPWLIKESIEYLEKEKKPEKISLIERINMLEKHIEILYEIKSEKEATLELRGILMYYLKHIPKTKELKMQVVKCNSKEEYLAIINKLRDTLL